ncbi:hypothetical protein [Leptospira perdikensis]|uniref:Uncharacterized protein n=1 Tax=Leptospira perdikensis TaxID=2484948 RepID=A0A4R9JFA5_9LEPT|nr:hypothetical protein [Leptospira perdikensis]TGL37257.1 hypothetical protein EHQ49_13510 [Leptospira perdikensis]
MDSRFKIQFGIVFCLFFQSSTLFAKLPNSFTEDIKSDYHQFWFLYESEKRGRQSYLAFRPFYMGFQDKTYAFRFKSYLSPFYYKEETNYWYTWSSLFFFSGTGFKHEEGDEDEDILFTPLFIWGKGESQRENYFSIFPIYGKIRNKLSYQELSYVLFPVYSEWKYKTYEAKSILWPFVMWGGSETRSDFRIFPLYSKKEHEGKYKRQSFLWPFFQWGEERLDKREPTTYSIFFPFYNSKDSRDGNMKSRAYLWFPILNSLFSYGYDKKTGQTNYTALFIFFQYTTSEKNDTQKLVFFPFYGFSYFANKEAEFITPFYIRLSQNTSHLKASSHFLLPFYSQMKSEYVQTGREDYYLKLWPLFRYHKDPDGNFGWNTLAIIPVRFEVMEDVWEPIFSIIEYKRSSNGEKRLHLITRLYTHRWTEEETHIHIPILLEYSKSPTGFRYELAYGFFGIDTRDTKNKYKLLWWEL